MINSPSQPHARRDLLGRNQHSFRWYRAPGQSGAGLAFRSGAGEQHERGHPGCAWFR